jgi:hypothetical protein
MAGRDMPGGCKSVTAEDSAVKAKNGPSAFANRPYHFPIPFATILPPGLDGRQRQSPNRKLLLNQLSSTPWAWIWLARAFSLMV